MKPWLYRAFAALAATLIASAATATEVNSAGQAELERVKGIGVALSDRLMHERVRAPFADWQDLLARVPGIGPRSAQRLSDAGLTVGGRAFSPSAERR